MTWWQSTWRYDVFNILNIFLGYIRIMLHLLEDICRLTYTYVHRTLNTAVALCLRTGHQSVRSHQSRSNVSKRILQNVPIFLFFFRNCNYWPIPNTRTKSAFITIICFHYVVCSITSFAIHNPTSSIFPLVLHCKSLRPAESTRFVNSPT